MLINVRVSAEGVYEFHGSPHHTHTNLSVRPFCSLPPPPHRSTSIARAHSASHVTPLLFFSLSLILLLSLFSPLLITIDCKVLSAPSKLKASS